MLGRGASGDQWFETCVVGEEPRCEHEADGRMMLVVVGMSVEVEAGRWETLCSHGVW